MCRHWEKAYAAALLEMDRNKMAERIDAARLVLRNSLRELGDSPEQNREKESIQDALRTLQVLQRTELNGPADD
jgi:chemotaxis regulatin CheY-phosphate phosphatase CheZ